MSASVSALPPGARPFLRFVVGGDVDDVRRLEGLFRFRFVDAEGESPEWPEELEFEVECLYEWFREHLRVPPFRRQGFSETAVCWFRSDARRPLARMWELTGLLRAAGVPVRLVRSWDPGQILYWDESQIVADRRWRRRPGRSRRKLWRARS